MAPHGVLGVELFFVLSGYLIGGILLRLARQGNLHTPSQLWDFWSRRWARTLPLYFFFVLVYLRFDYLGVADPSKIYPFLFFMQNFAWAPLPFFQHSWSLSVEEWFYAFFPLVFLAFARSEKAYKWPLLATCALFVVLPALARAWVAMVADGSWGVFNDQIRMVVVCRLDSIFFGVLLALVRAQWAPLYHRLQRWGAAAWAMVLAVAIYCCFGMPGLTTSTVLMVLGFPLLSLVIALGLPCVERISSLGWRPLDRAVTYTSKVSYSLYLGHICMITLVDSSLAKLGWTIEKGWSTLGLYALYAVAFYLFATLTYTYIEQPFLQLRDRGRAVH